jgi:caa(3)-type oxidase subunit IV
MSHASPTEGGMQVSRDTEAQHAGQPGQREYVTIAAILAVITAIEVGIYYAFQIWEVFLVLSLVKFVLVAMFFMHLKFDSRFFSVIFVTGIFVAVAVFVVFLTFLRVFFA